MKSSRSEPGPDEQDSSTSAPGPRWELVKRMHQGRKKPADDPAQPTALSPSTIALLDARIREEVARCLELDSPSLAEGVADATIDIDVLRSQVRRLIEVELRKEGSATLATDAESAENTVDSALLEQAVREVVGRKLGRPGKRRRQSKSSRLSATLDKAALESQIRRLLADRLQSSTGTRKRQGGARKNRLGDRGILKQQMREAVSKFLSELPPESTASLDDRDIERLIERAL